jgi:hypothetical protein
MQKIIKFLLILLILFSFGKGCSEAHGTGDHCDHAYRTCLRSCKGFSKQDLIKRGICLTVCLGCKGLSR